MQSALCTLFLVGDYMNVGKVFENQFKKYIPEYCVLQRLNDSPQGFIQSKLTEFTPKTPCDFIMFDTYNRELWCLELKSTKQKYISFEDINSNKEQNKMIHKHQILGLKKFGNYKHVNSGFLFNFRDEVNDTERTYYQDIHDFLNMCKKINKSSFNEIELVLNNAIKVNGEKLKVNYRWNINRLIEDVKNRK